LSAVGAPQRGEEVGPLPRRRAVSQQLRARVIAEEMGIAHIAAQRVHTPMAALVHHLEDRGAAPCGRCEETGPERMAGEEFRIKPFRQINRKTGNRLRQQLIDEKTRDPIDAHDKARGYEIGKGRFLLVEDEELEAIEIESTQTIDSTASCRAPRSTSASSIRPITSPPSHRWY
jgi:hypothetical protein